MITQFFTIGILLLLTAMLPGPDFAIVTKNTILYSRRTGIMTALGIASAVLIHISYCMLGLALVISQSLLIFNAIKYIGAFYLIYLGVNALLEKQADIIVNNEQRILRKKELADIVAFRQGFLCNLLNPKATLFFLALFTVVIKPHIPIFWQLVYAVEIFVIVFGWFFTLSVILSHPRMVSLLNKIEKYISKILGVFLIGFGLALAFAW